MKTFDVMVIGAGSAGRYGAQAAAKSGARVGLVETGPFGGLCILKGCMPTKAYLRSSDLVGLMKKAPNVGVYPGKMVGLRFGEIKERKDRLIQEMANYAKESIESNPNITLLSGKARFLSKKVVQVGRNDYSCEKFLIATGSRVVIPPFPGLEKAGYITSDDALELEAIPESLVILGGGAEALEFGQFFNRMGAKVTLLQRSRHILSGEDPDIGLALADYLREDGMTLHTGVRIIEINKTGVERKISFESEGDKRTLEAEMILVATGRTGNVEELDLDAAGVKCYDKGVEVNDFLQTSNPNIYAAGDVTGVLQVVNMATYQGAIAGKNLVKGPEQKTDTRVIPRAVFSDPEVARVGLSEREAEEQGIAVRVGKLPFSDLGKAIVTDRMEGFIKILADPVSGEILGVQILGAEASDLIHQGVVAMHFRATLSEYARISHIHPTLAEIMLYLVEEMMGED
jgi:dihydrolipoamide dehydrogenase/mercuric reductase